LIYFAVVQGQTAPQEAFVKTTEFRDITYRKDDHGIVTLELAIPERKNALSLYSFYEIYSAIDAFEADDEAYAMIMTGAPQPSHPPEKQAFSSGGYFDQSAFDALPESVVAELDFNDLAQKRCTLKLFRCVKPIVAAVNGYAIGGAATMILTAADQIYLSEHAWIQLPFAKLGISAELGSSFLLPRLLGMQKAKQILFYSERLDAIKAHELGLIDAVVPYHELLDYARQQTLKLVPPDGAPLSIRAMKRLLHAPLDADISDALDRENEALVRLFKTADFREGVKARIEKRAPVFKGE
jgi:enoyl-CoA hydratase/carnithine racemase